MPIQSIGSPILWIGFILFVLAMLAIDLGIFHKRPHAVKFREALSWSAVWIGLALLFNLGIYHFYGPERGSEFLVGYLVEKSLSVDNIFIILVIFNTFAVPAIYQHRVLFWGIIGAVILRAIFILVGSILISRFHWILYVFGGILILTAVKLMLQTKKEPHPENNILLRLFRRWIPMTDGYRGQSFFVKENGRLLATPLFMVLAAVEVTDLLFAVESIPAIFAITEDPFIVFTSNIFAILGLRSLYFLLAGVLVRFKYLKVGLALVLGFIGCKLLLANVYKVPTTVSLVVIATLIGGSMIVSWMITRKSRSEE